MNQLSWLIYWAGIVNGLGGWLTAFAIITFIMCVILVIWYAIKACNPDDSDYFEPPKPAWIMFPMFIFLLVTSIAIPSRDTVLAIAASEMGEKVLATPQAQRVGQALMNWIDVQSKPSKDSDSDDRH